MKKVNEEEVKKEVFKEHFKLLNSMQKRRRKIIITILSIIITLIILIKIFFGTIELYSIFGYPASKARYYKVSVNNKVIPVSYNELFTVPIIPFVVNVNHTYLGNSNISGNNDGPFFYKTDEDYFVINLTSYSCYYESIQTECKNDSQNMKLNNDYKLTHLKITRTSNPYEVVYDGEFTSDITPYVEEHGIYNVEITVKHGWSKSFVYFYFDSFNRD